MNKRKLKLCLLVYYTVPPALVCVSYVFDPGIISDPLLGASLVSGVIGYSWLMVQLLLSARLKWIERGIGQDRLLLFHRVMAPVSVALLVVHFLVKVLLYPASLQVFGGVIVFFGFLLVGFVSAALFSGPRKEGAQDGSKKGAKDRIFGGLQKLAYGKLKLQYQHIKALHNGTFLLTVIMFLHVIGSSTAEYSKVLRGYFIILFTAAAAAYMYHKLLRPWLFTPVYQVVAIDSPSPEITNIGLELVKGRGVVHSPGQFAFYRFLKGFPGKEEHPFTISAGAAPSKNNYLSFTAKALGDFTGALPQVPVGSRVKVDGPYGVFTSHVVSAHRPRVWIAGGIGITPFLSMARTLSYEGESREVQRPLLIWNVRLAEDFIYLNEFEPVAQVVQVLDSRDTSWKGRRGRITKELLEDVLSEETIKDALFFICGPPAMMQQVRTNLHQLGVDRHRMLWERFAL